MSNKFETYKEIEEIINNTLNVKTISEKLICLEKDENPDVVRKYLIDNRFDMVGIRDKNNVVGYTDLETLKKSDTVVIYNEFNPSEIVSSNTPLVDTLTLLNQKKYLFVLDGAVITRIVTKADIYKEPVRLFLYNLISNFETLLSILVEYYYPNNGWEFELSPTSKSKTNQIYDKRRIENTDFDRFDCLSLEIKIDLFSKKKELKGILGLSVIKQKKYFNKLKGIRNAIAHVGKNPAIANVEKILYMITSTTEYSHILAEEISKLDKYDNEMLA